MNQFFIVFLLLVSNLTSEFVFAREVLKNSPSPTPKITLVDPPQDLETCFSPDMPCSAKLVQFILSAKSSLDIAIYTINDPDITNAIIQIFKNKIPVRVIVDCSQLKPDPRSSEKVLKQMGVPVKQGKQNGYMHNKFTLVDNKMLETGSYNYTRHAAGANQENQVYLANPTIVLAYKKRFESMWEKAAEK